jgi:hypothetical protein
LHEYGHDDGGRFLDTFLVRHHVAPRSIDHDVNANPLVQRHTKGHCSVQGARVVRAQNDVRARIPACQSGSEERIESHNQDVLTIAIADHRTIESSDANLRIVLCRSGR